MKISDKLDLLKSKIDWFYGEEFNLDEAVESYKNVLSLADEVKSDLHDLKNEIKVLDKDFSKE